MFLGFISGFNELRFKSFEIVGFKDFEDTRFLGIKL
jgi:hypothetical protein